jgi:hypothetical protein
MILVWNAASRVYVFDCTYDERELAKAAHLKWDAAKRWWFTPWAKTAQLLIDYADADTKKRLQDAGHRRQAKDAKMAKAGAIKAKEEENAKGPWMGRNAKPGTPF